LEAPSKPTTSFMVCLGSVWQSSSLALALAPAEELAKHFLGGAVFQ
jgi:hypothetical protein